MILYINGSPKRKNSNSQYYIDYLNENMDILYLYNSFSADLDKYETLVFSMPLYLDSPPSIVLKYFEFLENNKVQNKNIYVICNCGFLESNNNDTLIDIFKTFSRKTNNNYKGCLKLGAGEVSGKCDKIPLYKLINIPLCISLKKFKKAIYHNKNISLNSTIFPMTKKLYIYFANKSFSKKLNNIK